MRIGWIATVALLVSTTLAGCTGTDDGSYVPDDAIVVTDPNDYSYVDQDAQAHIHDYWNGRETIQFMDFQDLQFTFTLGGGTTTCRSVFPEDGAYVPQGTARMEFATQYSEGIPNVIDGLELHVKTAAGTDPEYVGDIETSATQIVMETALEDADLPHQVLSAWELQVCATGGTLGGFRSVNVQVDLSAVAVNGLEIPLFPPHPDFWDGGNLTELPLIEEASGTTFFWLYSPPGCGYCSGGLYMVDMDDGRIVPPDATAIHVTMDYSAETPTTVGLTYHDARSRSYVPAPEVSDDGSTKTYEIPVDGNGDGPYAEQSLWQFYFQFEDGTGPYRGEWTLSATVVKDG